MGKQKVCFQTELNITLQWEQVETDQEQQQPPQSRASHPVLSTAELLTAGLIHCWTSQLQCSKQTNIITPSSISNIKHYPLHDFMGACRVLVKNSFENLRSQSSSCSAVHHINTILENFIKIFTIYSEVIQATSNTKYKPAKGLLHMYYMTSMFV